MVVVGVYKHESKRHSENESFHINTGKRKIFAGIRTLGLRTLMPWGHSLKIQEPSEEEFECMRIFFSPPALSADMYARGSLLV